MSISLTRRRALAALLSLPLVACSARPRNWVAEPPEPPAAVPGRVVLFLVPGLGLSDVLVAVGDGDLPNVGRMLEHGSLVESLEPAPDVILTPAEAGRELLGGWTYEALPVPCQAWDVGVEGVAADVCPAALSTEEALASWRDRLQAVGEGLRLSGHLPPAVVPLDGLLALQTEHLLVDAKQPGHSPEAALQFTTAWETALRALDTALGRVLNRVDLSSWTVALASTCEVWAVYERLDPSAVQGPSRILSGGAILEAEGGVALPEGEPWVGVQVGRDPESSGARLLAPPGFAFVPPEGTLPRAVPRPGGFLLGVGHGISQGVRLQAMAPASAGAVLRGAQPGV